MHRTGGRTLFGLAALLAAGGAWANWHGKSEAGFVMARGNTESDTANLKLEVIRELDRSKHTFNASALHAESNEVTTGSRWDTRWQSDLKLSDRTYWFGAVRYEEDDFSGFEYQGTLTTGGGYRALDTESTKLSLQLGAGYRRLRTQVLVRDETGAVTERLAGEGDAHVVGNAGVKFEHAFNEATKLFDTLVVESGPENTLVQNEISLQVKMNSVLALALGFTVRNNSGPPEGLEETDTLTTVGLVYEID